jgi:flagellar biosynthesis/type III secretory pathway chaperone
MSDKDLLIFYFQVTDLWKRFCESHQEMFELTCDEYYALLKNDLDKVDLIVEKKQTLMEYISSLNELREELIRDINIVYTNAKIENVSQLLSFMLATTIEKDEAHLNRFNTFLIDTIEKIQKQNSINQQFITKAMTSIESVRENLLGKSRYQTYDSRGQTKSLMRRS